MDDRGREREREKHFPYPHSHSRSRSRSRSPVQNGRLDSSKSESSFDKRYEDSKTLLKIKEERREDDLYHVDRDKLRNELRNDYLFGSGHQVANPMSANMAERARLLSSHPYFGADRLPPHPSMWNPYDKSSVDFNHHTLQLRQEMERERERMLTRLQPTSLLGLEQDRLRKEEMLFQDERVRREIMERNLFERERLAFEQSKLSSLRPGDHFVAPSHLGRTISPMMAGASRGSPACLPGAPPPLIPSSSATQTRSHSNSPAVGKPRGLLGPTDSSDLKDKRDSYSNSTDPDSHSR